MTVTIFRCQPFKFKQNTEEGKLEAIIGFVIGYNFHKQDSNKFQEFSCLASLFSRALKVIWIEVMP